MSLFVYCHDDRSEPYAFFRIVPPNSCTFNWMVENAKHGQITTDKLCFIIPLANFVCGRGGGVFCFHIVRPGLCTSGPLYVRAFVRQFVRPRHFDFEHL